MVLVVMEEEERLQMIRQRGCCWHWLCFEHYLELSGGGSRGGNWDSLWVVRPRGRILDEKIGRNSFHLYSGDKVSDELDDMREILGIIRCLCWVGGVEGTEWKELVVSSGVCLRTEEDKG